MAEGRPLIDLDDRDAMSLCGKMMALARDKGEVCWLPYLVLGASTASRRCMLTCHLIDAVVLAPLIKHIEFDGRTVAVRSRPPI